jgi:4-hydroxythreonine-4-phosphate dehydrogenase
LLLGDSTVLQTHARHLGLNDIPLYRLSRPDDRIPKSKIGVLDVAAGTKTVVHLGSITREAGALSMKAVETAVDLCMEGVVDAMVTAPISKEAIDLAGYKDKGHSGFIATRTGTDSYTMMMVADTLRVGLVTDHIPLRDVPAQVTIEGIVEKVGILSRSLVQDFAVDRPRIALLGLNPHAGDGGLLGLEEREVIQPAMEACIKKGHLVFGPFPADGFFAVSHYRNYDAVLAMYHDQGLIPFKSISFGHGVNFTAGLPIVRTSPDHGTAFNIAGKSQASADSMRSAIYLALDIVRQRQTVRQADGMA